ncbi:MAG: SDR family oxidoreductase [Bermanella sp.]
MSRNILITGANRGIGLALTKQYLSQGDTVYAVCRKASTELASLKDANVIEGIDVSDDKNLLTLKNSLTDVSLDIVINNAGIMTEETLGNIDFSAVVHQFLVNAVGPLKTTQSLLENLNKGSKVAIITSRMGSIGDNTSGGWYGYRMSKSAANSAAASLAQDLKPKGVSLVLLHPGFVQTDLVDQQGDVTATHAASNLVTRINELTLETTGSLFHANGESLPW